MHPIDHPAASAGESILSSAMSTTSSRRHRGGWLAGVLAASMTSALVASLATVGVFTATRADEPVGGVGATTASASASASSALDTGRTTNGTETVVGVAESASPAVVTLTVDSVRATGVGSGFVFDSSGLILTNDHVIDGATTITVAFQDGSQLPGTVVAADSVHDLAVVRVDATGLAAVPIGDLASLQVGQLVVAIGSPLGTFTESVTSGILSATGRSIEVGSSTSRRTVSMTGLLQTDAAINEGNSGGPLLDSDGAVIGVNVAVATSAQGIGFAVPIDAAAAIMAEARRGAGSA